MLCCSATSSAVDLTAFGVATQLPGQFGALGQAGGAERMPLGDQPARRVDYPTPAVGGIACVDEVVALTFGAQARALRRSAARWARSSRAVR